MCTQGMCLVLMCMFDLDLHRLQTERDEIQKQKEYFAKMRTEFQPDGGKVRPQYTL